MANYVEDETFKILLADNYPAIMLGISKFLQIHFPQATIVPNSTIEDLKQNIRAEKWDLIFIAYMFNNKCVLDLIPEFKKNNNPPYTLIYTKRREPWVISSLIKAQISGIIIKDENLSELADATQSILIKQEKYYSKSIFNILLAMAGDEQIKKEIEYYPTDREQKIISMLSMGYTSEMIADSLCITKSAVETIRKRILSKSNAANVSNLIRISLLKGWIE